MKKIVIGFLVAVSMFSIGMHAYDCTVLGCQFDDAEGVRLSCERNCLVHRECLETSWANEAQNGVCISCGERGVDIKSCGLCRNDIQHPNERTFLNCNPLHIFHRRCIEDHLRGNHNCPICNRPNVYIVDPNAHVEVQEIEFCCECLHPLTAPANGRESRDVRQGDNDVVRPLCGHLYHRSCLRGVNNGDCQHKCKVCAFPTIHVIAGERGNRREYYSGEDNMMARGEWQVLDRNQFHSHEGLDAHQVDVARRRWVEQRMQPEMNRYRDYIPRNMENLHWGPYADRLFERQQQVMNERGYELRQMGDTWVRVNRNAPRTEQPNVRPQIPRPRYEPPVYQPPYRPEWVIDVTGEDLRGGEVRGEDLRGGLFGLGAVAGAGALAGYTAEQKKKAFMLLAVVGGGLLGCAGLLKYKESKQAEYERDIAAIEGRSISRTEKDRLIRERSTWRQKYLPGWMKRMFKMRVDWSRA